MCLWCTWHSGTDGVLGCYSWLPWVSSCALAPVHGSYSSPGSGNRAQDCLSQRTQAQHWLSAWTELNLTTGFVDRESPSQIAKWPSRSESWCRWDAGCDGNFHPVQSGQSVWGLRKREFTGTIMLTCLPSLYSFSPCASRIVSATESCDRRDVHQ